MSGRVEYTRLTVLRVAVKAALAGTGPSAVGRERKTGQGHHFKKKITLTGINNVRVGSQMVK
jgi:hypothetical protein